MGLKFEVDSLDGIEDGVKTLYKQHTNGKYRLEVEGIDPADELKEALRKEREERAAAKAKLKEIEDARTAAERAAAEKNGEFEKLYKQMQEAANTSQAELNKLKSQIADKERNENAQKIVSQLTRDNARATLLSKEALQYIQHTPEGIKINGPDGAAWDAAKLSEHLKSSYPFLVDGSQASGAGAQGGGTSGAGKEVSRTVFDGWTQAQRHAHVKGGGKISD